MRQVLGALLWVGLLVFSLLDLPYLNLLAFVQMVPILFVLLYSVKFPKGLLFFSVLMLTFQVYNGMIGYSWWLALGVMLIASLSITTYFWVVWYFLHRQRADAVLGYFWLAFGWVGMEYLLLLGNVPLTLGLSQHRFIPFIQSASLLGIPFTSFLVVIINYLIFFLCQGFISKFHIRHIFIGFISLALLLGLNLSYGYWVMQQTEVGESLPLRIGVIQPDIKPRQYDYMFEREGFETVRNKLTKMVAEFGTSGVDVIVWPEVGTDTWLFRNPVEKNTISKLAIATKAMLVLGSMDRSTAGEETNSIFYVSPEGNVVNKYDKILHIPFVESHFGSRRVIPKVIVPNSTYTISGLICFESVFAGIARKIANAGNDLILVLSNDAYFHNSLISWLHSYYSVFRAVETGRPVLRVANNGVSELINANGMIVKRLPVATDTTGIFEISPGGGTTLFLITGNVFAWVCIFVLVVSLGIVFTSRLSPSNTITTQNLSSSVTPSTYRVYIYGSLMIVSCLAIWIGQVELGQRLVYSSPHFRSHISDLLYHKSFNPDYQHRVDTYYKQQTVYSCGPAAMSYLLSRFGFYRFSENQLMELTNSTKASGTNMAAIVKGFGKIGLSARAMQMNYAALQKQKMPLMAYLYKHFVVVKDVGFLGVTFYDPLYGAHYRLTPQEFDKYWEGYVITVSTKEVSLTNGAKI